ncbi:DUF6447 family protein [Marinobacter fuscus]|uniref:DUF6447 family protein n=1 Tax=Marinobacter fuscus TaxID=2109942 RepID=UPI00197EB0D1|nr:DUF6447 family protein [Marinobacter fuscus]
MTDTKKAADTKKTAAAKTKAPAKKAPAKKAAAPKKAAAKASEGQQVTINDKTYPLDALSDNAKAQINNLRATDRLIEELELELAVARTARSSYAEALQGELDTMNTTLQ